MITAVQLVQGDGASPAVRKACQDAEAALGTELERYGLDAYPLVVAAPDLRVGATTLLQSWGIGPIQSNTVLLNWFDSRDPEQQPQLSLWYAGLLQRAARLDQHVVVLDADDEDWQSLDQTAGESRRIDVWWFENDSSRLALLLAYLMTRHEEWEDATLRLLTPAPASTANKREAHLRHRLDELRIDAEIVVVPMEEEDAMYGRSARASFVLLPLRLEGMSTLHPTGGPVDALFSTMPVLAMVAAAGDVKLKAEEEEETPVPAAAPADGKA